MVGAAVDCMARPSATRLNSLAEILRQAHPPYSECRLILDYLDNEGEMMIGHLTDDPSVVPNLTAANKDELSKPQRVLEPTPLNRKSIV